MERHTLRLPMASLATALLAAVVLETIGTPLLQAPIYSVIRAVQATPITMLSAVNLRPKDRLSILVFALLAIEVLVTLVSQFFSTILITDFAVGSYANRMNTADVAMLNLESGARAGSSKWFAMPPALSWTFAEASESFIKGSNFHDTGHTYRGFLPFADEERRTKLRRFHGPATVMDQRVVCPSRTATMKDYEDLVVQLSNITEAYDYAHGTHVALFQSTLLTTQSPALATQALLARLFQMAYYDQLVKLTTAAKALTSSSSTNLIPSRWTGFIAVTTLVAAHLLVVATTTLLFLRHTESSMIGNYWQAVSQVFSMDTQQVVQQADRMMSFDLS
ncbi:hypothetical protein N0V88_007432 [Collariella sp. IMI 366227]|nr:hypothetical protein N0V88_007432 [Collariella sp. IMI 366227]